MATIKDGFKLGIGFVLAAMLVILLAFGGQCLFSGGFADIGDLQTDDGCGAYPTEEARDACELRRGGTP